jgi:hypothetical protein
MYCTFVFFKENKTNEGKDEPNIISFLCKILVEEELLIIPEHLSSPPVFSGVRVTPGTA